MKTSPFLSLALILFVPFLFSACQENSEPPEDSQTESQASDSHLQIATEYYQAQITMGQEMLKITDIPSAEVFSNHVQGTVGTLQSLLERAQALPSPTAEEKAQINALKESQKAQLEAFSKNMGNIIKGQNRTKEEQQQIGAIMFSKGAELGPLGQQLDSIYAP